MEINTLEDVERSFPDDESVRKIWFEARWGKFATCPYCDNEKCYFVKNNRYKCAKCRLLFSVTVKTLFCDNKIPLTKLIKYLYLYTKSRGRTPASELSKLAELSAHTEFFAHEKVNYIWANIDRVGKTNIDIIKEIFKLSATLYEKYNSINESRFSKYPFHIAPDEINDISNQQQWDKLIRYTKYFIEVYCKNFYFIEFASPEDILSEVFIYFKEKGIRDYNTDVVLKAIWRISARMWVEYMRKNPKYHDYIRKKTKEKKRRMISELKENYVIDILMKQEKTGRSRMEIKKDKKLINEKREQLLRKRSKRGTDFTSHFS